MKLFIYKSGGHHKNWESIKRMCALFSIECIVVQTLEEIKNQSTEFDLIWSHHLYIPPETLSNRKILIGPQLFVLPQGEICGSEITSLKHLYAFTCLSPWVKELYSEISSLKIPLIELPFGVDTNKFRPETPISQKNEYFIYFKNRHPSLLESILNLLHENLGKQHIFRYGSYQEGDYIEILKKSKFGIWIGCHESQGFALQEALASDVPLLVFNVRTMKEEFSGRFVYQNYKQELKATTIGYWSKDCGEVIYDLSDFKKTLEILQSKIVKGEYYPRKFIEENLSDHVCMKRILNYFNLV